MSRPTTSRVRWRWLWLLIFVALWVIGARYGDGDRQSDDQEVLEVLPFVPYELSVATISPPERALVDKRGRAVYFPDAECAVGWMEEAGTSWQPDAWADTRAYWEAADEESERNVMIVTMRWSDQSQFDKAARRMTRSMDLPCSTTAYQRGTFTEPIELDGLPSEARAVRWLGYDDQVAVVMFDTDSQTAMYMVWKERHGTDYEVPADDLVEVANLAWTEFLADNPPLD